MRDGGGRLPDYLIVGTMKSATTSLAALVDDHPDAFCTAREVHYFDRYEERGLEWYRSRFPSGAALVGEPTPEYMYMEEVPPRIAAVVPEAKLLATLRQPVDRAYSHYWHNRTRGHEDREFVDAVAAEEERMARATTPRERARFAYLDRGRYARQLSHLERHFPADQIHVALFDDLVADESGTMAEVYRFLGLRPHRPTLSKRGNPFVEYRSQRLRPLIRRLPGPAQKVAGRLNVRQSTYPKLDAGLRRELTARFADEITALEARLGRSLSAWRCA